MKLTFVLLLCVMSQVFALASAQTVSLKKQNASLEEILWELKEKTQLVFMYSDEDIASVKGIDIDMKNTQVDAILNSTGSKCDDQFGFPDFTGVCYYPGIFFSVG